ncbi:MAG: hypothetical protein ACK56F_14595, partial [bacterium]
TLWLPLSGVQGWEVHAHPLSQYLPLRTKLWCTRQVQTPPIFTLPLYVLCGTSAQPVRVEERTHVSFTISTITYKVVVYALAERAGTLPLFILYPYKYSVLDPFS